ncbi:hypothetical protein P7K49_020625, partial [Saguinus oedipus]
SNGNTFIQQFSIARPLGAGSRTGTHTVNGVGSDLPLGRDCLSALAAEAVIANCSKGHEGKVL